MNCPYCDETVHLMSKFCPKCGLPLKDDATVVGGAYLTDEPGPAKWVVGGGAALIVVIALAIGWMGSQKNAAAPQASRREPVPVNPAFTAAPGFTAGFGSAAPVNPALGFGAARPSQASANYHPQVRWAYVPPAGPPPRLPVAEEIVRPELPPQPLLLAANPVLDPPEPATVRVPRVTTPPVPEGDTVPPPPTLGPGEVYTPPQPAAVPSPLDGATIATGGQRLVDSPYVYDPVQERYVLDPERAARARRLRQQRRSRGAAAPAAAPLANAPAPSLPPPGSAPNRPAEP